MLPLFALVKKDIDEEGMLTFGLVSSLFTPVTFNVTH